MVFSNLYSRDKGLQNVLVKWVKSLVLPWFPLVGSEGLTLFKNKIECNPTSKNERFFQIDTEMLRI